MSIKKITQTQTYTGRLYEGKDEMVISTDDGIMYLSSSIIDKVLSQFDGKRAKVVITIEAEEIP